MPPHETATTNIDKLAYRDDDANQPLLRPGSSGVTAHQHHHDGDNDDHEFHGQFSGSRRISISSSTQPSHAGEFFEHVAEGIQDVDRQRLRKQVVRYLSFVWAIVSCLCGGSITAFSLYGHLFQTRLQYTQAQVNIVSIVAELGLYLPVPLVGLLVDRYGPGPSSLLSGLLFGGGYLVAGFAYKSGPPVELGGHGWPFASMVVAFIGIGAGTVCMYLPAVTTCAKNFGRGKHRGFALAAPIASFGLGGMWQSQVGSRLIFERNADGSRGEVDVYRYFLFLGVLLCAVGVIGSFALQIVGEDELIDEAVEHLEQSGVLEDSQFFARNRTANGGYGTMDSASTEHDGRLSPKFGERAKRRASVDQRKKTWLLNEETRRFLSDRTMWWLAAGFFLVTGPGEAFINNMGTVIGTLYPPPSHQHDRDHMPPQPSTSVATHVSIVAITSTVARLFVGTISDALAPVAERHPHRGGPDSLLSSLASLDPLSESSVRGSRPNRTPSPLIGRFSVSRVVFLLAFTLILSMGLVILASGTVQDHAAQRFWLVSALIGTGYGATFSLVPIIISCVWGVENFGTNWGIVAVVPAGGAALWGIVYATVYEWAAAAAATDATDPAIDGHGRCYGAHCYQGTFWAMAGSVWVACALWMWAWRGPGGWLRRGVLV